jgi:hypothetical protein
MLTDLLGGQVEQAIELTSPDEDAVLHDYGKYIVDRVRYHPAPARINSISFIDSAISGGTQVSLKSIDVTVHGQRVSITREGNCVQFRGMGQDQRLCRRNIARIAQASGVASKVVKPDVGFLEHRDRDLGIRREVVRQPDPDGARARAGAGAALRRSHARRRRHRRRLRARRRMARGDPVPGVLAHPVTLATTGKPGATGP